MGLPATTSMPGMNMFMAPNVVKLPPLAIPAPMPSLGLTATTIPMTQAFNVFCSGTPTSVVGSMSPVTLPADAAGLMLGNTGTICGPTSQMMGSTGVFFLCRCVSYLMALVAMNTNNTVGGSISGQFRVFVRP